MASAELIAKVDKEKFPEKLVTEINGLLSRANTIGEKVSICEAILDRLKKANLAWNQQIAANRVGVSMHNRAGFGLAGAKSQQLGKDILEQGWSWAKCASAVGMEPAPAPHNKNDLEFNARVVDLSSGLIPKLESSISLFLLSAGHTNCFLRQVLAGVPSVVPTLADADGKLNAAMLKVNREGFSEALDLGLKWTVIAWECVVMFPNLPDILQDGLNTSVRTQQGEVEVMLQMHEHYKASVAANVEPDWKAIEKAAALSNPQCSTYLHTLSEWVQKNSGGVDGCLLKDLSDFQRAFGRSQGGVQRSLGGEYIGKILNMQLPPGKKCPYLQLALLKANILSPDNKVIDGVCRLITPANINVLASKAGKELAVSCEKVLADARGLVSAMPCDDSTKVQVLGQLDCRVALHALKKTKEVEGKTYANIAEIGAIFAGEVAKKSGMAVVGQQSSTVNDGPASGSSSQSTHVETMAEMKSAVFQAEKLGFCTSALIAKRKSELAEVWRIIDIAEDSVVVGLLDKGSIAKQCTITMRELMEDWRLHKGTVTTMLTGWAPGKGCPLTSKVWLYDICKGQINVALQRVYQARTDINAYIQIMQKPNSVMVTKEFDIGEVQLAAASLNIAKKPASSSCYLGDFNIGGDPEPLYLNYHFAGIKTDKGDDNKSPWVCPFWMCSGSSDDEACNCELKYEKVSVFGQSVFVPIIVNTKKLAINDLLTWNKSSASKCTTPGDAERLAIGDLKGKAFQEKKAGAAKKRRTG